MNTKKVAPKGQSPKGRIHPSYKVMVAKAIQESKNHKGEASRQAIKKYILANYKVDASKFDGIFKVQFKKLLTKGDVTQIGGKFKTSDQGKAKRSPKKKTTGPKRPKSAYIFWAADHRVSVKKANPTATPQQILSLVAADWKKVSPKEKTKYEKLAVNDKVRYEKEAAAAK